MLTTNDVHRQFAAFFPGTAIHPIAYLLSKKLSEGHICVSVPEMKHEDEAFELKSDLLLGDETDLNKPFILHEDKFYLQRYFKYETQILNRIIEWIKSDQSPSFFEETDLQLLATKLALANKFTIITGGPGTGKTTTVAHALGSLLTQQPSLRVALAAPTGKAAMRLAESLKNSSDKASDSIKKQLESLVPGTVHRLLGHKHDSPYFKHNAENPLPYDLIIVDESSMIDAALFAKLIDAIAADAKLILLGDKDQLSSVEAGSLFGDICDALLSVSSQNIVQLKKSFRFSDTEGIGRLSKIVINGDLEALDKLISAEDKQVQIDLNYERQIFESFVLGYEAYILEPDIKKALGKFNSLRVLCAIRSGDSGLTSINKKIEKYLQQQKLIKPLTDFYLNRPVMVGKNHYDIGVFNGDIGIVRPDENGILKAWFEDSSGELKSVLPGFISEAETAFAMTIHKSQGSEYDRVMLVMPNTELPILTAELLYTGVSRAKSKLIIQSTKEVLESCIGRRVQRASGIADRLKKSL